MLGKLLVELKRKIEQKLNSHIRRGDRIIAAEDEFQLESSFDSGDLGLRSNLKLGSDISEEKYKDIPKLRINLVEDEDEG